MSIVTSAPKIKLTKQQKAIITQEIADLETHRAASGKLTEEWEHFVHENYNGYGADAIMNMMCYHENVQKGFGTYNCESNYIEHSQRDKDGTWLEEAMRGVELYMNCSRFTKKITDKKKERGDYGCSRIFRQG
jgi:hypothetical protein